MNNKKILYDTLNIKYDGGDKKFIENVMKCLLKPKEDTFECLLEFVGDCFEVDKTFVFGIYNKGAVFDEIVEWTGDGVNFNYNTFKDMKSSNLRSLKKKLNNEGKIIIEDIERLSSDLEDNKAILNQDISSIVLFPVIKNKEIVGIFGASMVDKMRDWEEETIENLNFICDILSKYWDEWMEKDKYLRIFNYSGIASVVLDESLIIQDVNKAFEILSGYSEKELVGKKKFMEFIHPDYRDMMSAYHEKRLRGEEVPEQYEFNFIDRKKNVKSIEITVSLQSGTGNTIISLQDSTELKNTYYRLAEKKYKLVEKNKELKVYNRQLVNLNKKLEKAYNRSDKVSYDLENLIRLLSGITEKADDISEFFSSLLQTAVNIVEEAEYGSVFQVENDCIQFIDVVGHNGDVLKEFDINIDFFSDLNVKKEEEIITIKNPDEFKERHLAENIKNEFEKLFNPLKEFMLIKIAVNNKFNVGLTLGIGKGSGNSFARESMRVIGALKNLAGAFLSLKRYNKLQDEFYHNIILSITKMLEIHDKYTRGHSRSVAKLSVKIAKNMGLDEKMIEKVYLAGMLHDIGKILIPRTIINKRGSLDDEEFELIKKHPVWGCSTLQESGELEEIARYILYHHERWDGNGYPEGLAGEEIPLVSQILGLADAWNAMRSNRAYRDALSFEEALDEVLSNKGTQFSPRIVDVFIKNDGDGFENIAVLA